MKVIFIISAIASAVVLYFTFAPLLTQTKLLYVFFIIVFIFPLVFFFNYFWRTYLPSKLRGRLNEDEREFYRNPNGYFALKKQVKNLKKLKNKGILSVSILKDSKTIAELKSIEEIDGFRIYLPGRVVLTAKNEFDDRFEFEIKAIDKNYNYKAYTIPGNTDDIILKFPECDDYGGIQLTGLKRWLDENVLKKKK